MPISPTNVTKSATTPTSVFKGGVATWGDARYTWGDESMVWGGASFTPSNLTKTATTPTNVTKS